MSAFVTRFPVIVNEIKTKISVLPYREDASKSLDVAGLWDTGAMFSVVSRRVAEMLHLEAVDLKRAYTANGWYETPVYRVDVILPNGVRVAGLHVSRGELMVCDMLIGMDVIRHGDFMITNGAQTEFAFRIPAEGSAPI